MPSNNDPWGDCAVYTSQIVQQPGELVCAKGRLHETMQAFYAMIALFPKWCNKLNGRILASLANNDV